MESAGALGGFPLPSSGRPGAETAKKSWRVSSAGGREVDFQRGGFVGWGDHRPLCRFAGGAADAHIYFNLADNLDGGFGIHWDFSHNLIVQMEGETQFKVWDDTVVGDRNPAFLNEQPIIDVVMQPGDAVFVPMNVFHQAISKSKRMSVSFPISMNNDTANQDRHWIKIS